MSGETKPGPLAMAAAEEVLQHIYGDDLHGCTVSMESIGAIIESALRRRSADDAVLLELYEKLVEAVQLLSTPPKKESVTEADELRTLLGERLDTIRDLIARTIRTTDRFKAERKAAGNGNEVQ